MDPLLTCTCGGTWWEEHTAVQVSLQVARGTGAQHHMPASSMEISYRCIACGEIASAVIAPLG